MDFSYNFESTIRYIVFIGVLLNHPFQDERDLLHVWPSSAVARLAIPGDIGRVFFVSADLLVECVELVGGDGSRHLVGRDGVGPFHVLDHRLLHRVHRGRA